MLCCGYYTTDLNPYLRNRTQQYTFLFPKFMLNVSVINDLLSVRYVQASIFALYQFCHDGITATKFSITVLIFKPLQHLNSKFSRCLCSFVRVLYPLAHIKEISRSGNHKFKKKKNWEQYRANKESGQPLMYCFIFISHAQEHFMRSRKIQTRVLSTRSPTEGIPALL